MKAWLVAVLVLVASPVCAQPNLLADVAAERAQYPTPISGAQIGQLLNAVVVKHPEFRLMAKPSGNNCPQPVTQTRISCDILLHPPSGHWFDVLQDAEGDGSGIARPQWTDNGIGDMSQAVAAVDPGQAPVPVPAPTPVPVPVPTPTPIPVPPTLDLSGVYLRLSALSAQVAEIDTLLKKHDKDQSVLVDVFGNRYVQLILTAVGTYLAQKELTK